MSGKLMAQVYEYLFEHGQQSVLLAMADHAQDDGTHIFPSVPYLAWKTDYSERQVQRIIHALVKQGVLIVAHAARGQRATEYRMTFAAASRKPVFRPKGDTVSPLANETETFDTVRGDTSSPLTTVTPDIVSPLTGDTMTPVTMSPVTFDAQRGDICDTRGDIAVSPRTSIRTSNRNIREPSERPARAAPKKMATRIPDPFMVTVEMLGWAKDESIPRDTIQRETEKFCDYWRAAPNSKGLKEDWPATWRNWMRNASDGRRKSG